MNATALKAQVPTFVRAVHVLAGYMELLRTGGMTQTIPAPPPASRPQPFAGRRPTPRLLNRLREMPDTREHLVARVRGELAAGGYLTPEKLNAAADRLADDIERGL